MLAVLMRYYELALEVRDVFLRLCSAVPDMR